MGSERIELVRAWVAKAENDLNAAKIIMQYSGDNVPFDTACFHCQQAAEKFLKAYCIYLDIEFPKTHLLSTLMDLISSRDKDVFILEQTNILSNYGVSIRYPDDFYMPSRDELSEAFVYAETVYNYVRSKLNEEVL